MSTRIPPLPPKGLRKRHRRQSRRGLFAVDNQLEDEDEEYDDFIPGGNSRPAFVPVE